MAERRQPEADRETFRRPEEGGPAARREVWARDAAAPPTPHRAEELAEGLSSPPPPPNSGAEARPGAALGTH